MKNRKKGELKMKKIIVCGLMMLGLVLSNGVYAAQKQTLQIEGSTTVGPIADAFAESFKNDYLDLEITVKKTGSGDGAAALVDGRCDIAVMSRFMKTEEFKKAVDKGMLPVTHIVAMDGVCMVVHPSNPVKELTSQQIKDIYLGKITNWKQVGGSDLAIVPVSRDTSSGTFEVFHEIIMKKQDLAKGVEYVNSNPQAHARVQSTSGAIAYVGLGFLDGNVKDVKVDGISPSKETISSGVYPISRPLFMFTNSYPKLGSMTHKFCTFYLTEIGQEIIEAKGFVPVTNY